MIKLSVFFLSVLLLGGCAAGLGEDFSCNKVGGVPGCTSMDEIRNNMGHYTALPKTNVNVNATTKDVAPNSFVTLPRRDRHGEPVRTQEEVKKVTIFPFRDVNKHYIDTLDIYFVLDESRWTGRPARAIWED